MTASEPVNEPGADDTPPPVDPAVAALYRPPFLPGIIQFHVVVHVDPDGLWAEVPELPGLFATGETAVQLGTSLGEAVEAYLIERTVIVQLDGTEETP